MNIRFLEDRDIPQIVKIHHEAVMNLGKTKYSMDVLKEWALPVDGDAYYAAIEKELNKFHASKNSFTFVAEYEDKGVVAFCTIHTGRSELVRIYIYPEFSGKGIGRELLSKAEKEAKNRGVTSLSMDGSLNAEGFYNKMGYTTLSYEEHTLPQGARMKCAKMTKKLS